MDIIGVVIKQWVSCWAPKVKQRSWEVEHDTLTFTLEALGTPDLQLGAITNELGIVN
jgi:hypothetical protein